MADQVAEGLLSPFLRARRLAAVRPFLRGRVLDFGCGTGALAAQVAGARYLGVDRDEASLAVARTAWPRHRFQTTLPPVGSAFDTVVALAVIEHLADPQALLSTLAHRLAVAETSRLVVTTPHPSVDWLHHAGAAIGLFSRHASEEHETLLDRRALMEIGAGASLRLDLYRRFLLGANQLAVFRLVGDGK